MPTFVKAEGYHSSDRELVDEVMETEENAIAFALSVPGSVSFARNRDTRLTRCFAHKGPVLSPEETGCDFVEAGWAWYDKVFDSQELEAVKTRRLAALAMKEVELDQSLRHEDLIADFRAMQAELREVDGLEGKEQLDEADKSKRLNQFGLLDNFFKFCDSRPILDPIFYKTISGDWINCDSATWLETWINPFECLGKEEAACLPPPQLDEWHEPTYDAYCSSGTKDPAIAALQSGANLEEVKKLFKEPTDLLRWEIDGVDSDHSSLIKVALVGHMKHQHNQEVLEHLLGLSPKYFMQQMSMTSGGYSNATILDTIFTCGGRQDVPAGALLRVVQWICSSGIMTETLFAHCRGKTGWGGEEQRSIPKDKRVGIRPVSWKSAVDVAQEEGVGDDVVAELRRWETLPAAEKRQATEQRFEDLLAPALPKKVVNIKAKGASIECCSLTGALIATIEVDQGADSEWLIGRIAAALELEKTAIRVVTSQGQILQLTSPVPLADCIL